MHDKRHNQLDHLYHNAHQHHKHHKKRFSAVDSNAPADATTTTTASSLPLSTSSTLAQSGSVSSSLDGYTHTLSQALTNGNTTATATAAPSATVSGLYSGTTGRLSSISDLLYSLEPQNRSQATTTLSYATRDSSADIYDSILALASETAHLSGSLPGATALSSVQVTSEPKLTPQNTLTPGFAVGNVTDTLPSSTPGLSTTSKAVIGGVVGGLGGIGVVCGLILVVFTKKSKLKSTASASASALTPQRMINKNKRARTRTLSALSTTSQESRQHINAMPRDHASSFQVISGRRLSSPPFFYVRMGESGSLESSPRSGYTTPSRRSRLGGTPTIFRDPGVPDAVGRSQGNGSTLSHMSRFVERLGDT